MAKESSLTGTPLKRSSLWGKVVCLIGALAILAYGAYLAAVPDEAVVLMREAVPGIVTLPSTPILLAAACLAAAPALLFLACLLVAWQVFDAAGKSALYSPRGQHLLSRLSKLALLSAVAGVLCRTVAALLLTSANPPGQKMLVIGISSGEIAAVIVALLLAIFANVVREAAALAQENKLFI